MALISRRMTYSSFYVTAFPIEPLLGVLSYPRRPVYGRTYTYIMINWSAASFGGVVDRGRKHLGKKGIRDMRYPGIQAEDWPGVLGPAGFWA